MAFMRCEVWFEVEREGRTVDTTLVDNFNTDSELGEQVKQSVEDWIDRRKRIRSQDYSLVKIIAIHLLAD